MKVKVRVTFTEDFDVYPGANFAGKELPIKKGTIPVGAVMEFDDVDQDLIIIGDNDGMFTVEEI